MKPRIGDFVIGILIFLLAAGIWLYPHMKEEGKLCRITIGGKLHSKISLSDDGEMELPGCIVRVKNGEVYVTDSDCPDKVCENTGRISKSGESIICVPNRISIEISGEAENDVIAG